MTPTAQHGDGGCDHRFVYGGLRFADGVRHRPGSGATNTYYGHVYHCERCLAVMVEPTANEDRNSYQKRLDGASPASSREREQLVPKHDATWY